MQAKKKPYESPKIEPKPDEKPERRVIPDQYSYRRCPRCYDGEENGVGTCYTTATMGGKKVRYYKCDRCGFGWTVDIRTTETPLSIRYHEVDVPEQR